MLAARFKDCSARIARVGAKPHPEASRLRVHVMPDLHLASGSGLIDSVDWNPGKTATTGRCTTRRHVYVRATRDCKGVTKLILKAATAETSDAGSLARAWKPDVFRPPSKFIKVDFPPRWLPTIETTVTWLQTEYSPSAMITIQRGQSRT